MLEPLPYCRYKVPAIGELFMIFPVLLEHTGCKRLGYPAGRVDDGPDACIDLYCWMLLSVAL